MREIRDNLEKYGITELDKCDRKQFTRKQTESDSDESEVKGTKKGTVSNKKVYDIYFTLDRNHDIKNRMLKINLLLNELVILFHL